MDVSRTLLSAMLCAGLAACAERPASSLPIKPHLAASALVIDAAGSSGQPLPAHWWRLYQDAQLDRLVEQALQHNHDLAAAEASARALMAGLGRERLGRLPEANLRYGYGYGRSEDDQVLAEARDESVHDSASHELGLSLSYELDFWGRVSQRIAAARADAEVGQALVDELRVKVAAQTSRAYLRACGLGHRQAVQQQMEALLGRQSQLMQREAQAGLLTAFDLQRQQALMEQTRAQSPVLQAEREVALFELAVLTGQPASEVDQAAAACEALPQGMTDLPAGDGWALLARRPDIRAAERRLVAAGARVGVAEAERYPQVRFGAVLTGSAEHFSELGDSRSISYAVGPLLSWSVPDPGLSSARVEQREARRDEARARFDGVVLQALGDVRKSLSRYVGEREHRQRLGAAVQASEQAQHLAEAGWRGGSLDALDLLDSERSLVTLQEQLADADLRLVERQIDVFQALGGGWQDRPALADSTVSKDKNHE